MAQLGRHTCGDFVREVHSGPCQGLDVPFRDIVRLDVTATRPVYSVFSEPMCAVVMQTYHIRSPGNQLTLWW